MENQIFSEDAQKKRMYCLELAATTLGSTIAGRNSLGSAFEVVKAATVFQNFIETGKPE